LLLLRAAVGGTLVVLGVATFTSGGPLSRWFWAAGLLAAAGGASLVIGFLTPVAGAAAALAGIGIVLWWPLPTRPFLLDGRLAAAMIVAMAAAVVLLGPGALSLDARLFGRREITIPERSTPVSED